jgi:hypothetical protein
VSKMTLCWLTGILKIEPLKASRHRVDEAA